MRCRRDIELYPPVHFDSAEINMSFFRVHSNSEEVSSSADGTPDAQKEDHKTNPSPSYRRRGQRECNSIPSSSSEEEDRPPCGSRPSPLPVDDDRRRDCESSRGDRWRRLVKPTITPSSFASYSILYLRLLTMMMKNCSRHAG